jgi:pimeloyl-ACP methyl ester carboxylesterase
MKQTEIIVPDEFLSALNINGMKGRILNVPHKKNYKKKNSPEILMIYGHHSSLERMYSLVQNISAYGNVTMPDLPGFGGMDSFYTINKLPNLDNMADYLATFIKLNYKKKKFNIVGMSYGFLVVTRMLQKYPDIARQVNIIVSIVGFSHSSDFMLSKKFYNNLLYGSKIAKTSLVSFVIDKIVLRRSFIRYSYNRQAHINVKLKDANQAELAKRINFEIYLWKINDVRTYFYTTEEFLKIDLTGNKVKDELHHISVRNDQYFSLQNVEANLNKIYEKVTVHIANIPNHAPTVISDVKEAGHIIPNTLKPYLKKLK